LPKTARESPTLAQYILSPTMKTDTLVDPLKLLSNSESIIYRFVALKLFIIAYSIG
jgi:hypothetical protein